MEKFEEVINNDGVPEADDQNDAQPIIEKDTYINTEIGLPVEGRVNWYMQK